MIAAAVGWAGVGYLGWIMFSATPRIAAFDLDLLVNAGRLIGQGGSPYSPALVAGQPPLAVDLFYSYPPVVGQALAPIAGLPLGLIAVLWSAIAILLFAAVTVRIAALVGSTARPRTVAAAAIAAAAATFPLLIAVLFGNLDAFFPWLFGLVLVGALSTRPRDQAIGGAAIALGALTKLYPSGFGLWFVVRSARPSRDAASRRQWLIPVAAAIVATLAVVAVSVLVFGLGPWQDYASVAATAARAELVDPRNGGPAAQLALWLHADSGLARLLHLPVLAAALLAIAGAAWFREDVVESLAIATVATLVLLPVSWIHYPAALLPFVAAAVLRAHGRDPATDRRVRVRVLAVAALVAAAISIAWLPSLWLAVGLA
ncbi:MAG: DUF2029 domain-containing protein, partial [Chloroflexi bacterium]|nr:DUF2029 domain-containing protein [Chloroflexota bacterium]